MKKTLALMIFFKVVPLLKQVYLMSALDMLQGVPSNGMKGVLLLMHYIFNKGIICLHLKLLNRVYSDQLSPLNRGLFYA